MTTSDDPLLEGLNPAQREAVESIEGPVLVVAGPGSGKTRVITHRIAYLIRKWQISPYRILAVTFTNRAAGEMKERLSRLVGSRMDRLSVGTFHAFCAGLLRREGAHIGLDPSFTIYDDDDQVQLMKEAMAQVNIDSKQYHVRAIQGAISRSKSLVLDAAAYAAKSEGFFEQQVSKVYEKYDELIKRSHALDFDDLLLMSVQLLRENQDVLERYQRRFQHILIDEFQDTNVAQYTLAKLLAGQYRNICVVGDADQSIYGWRHADIRNILGFQTDFPEARSIVLGENYRSTGNIVGAAQKVISANTQRIPKELWTSKEQGPPVVVHETHDEEEEAQYVISEVERLGRVEGAGLGDCAVMYRVNAQSRALEEGCLRYGLRYKLVGGVRFYQRKEVKDLIAYLRLIGNPQDDVSLVRAINVPRRGIGAKSMDDLSRWATSRGISMYGALESLNEDPQDGVSLRTALSSRAAAQMAAFLALAQELAEESTRIDVVALIDSVLERTRYQQYVAEHYDFPEERWENIMELRRAAEEFKEEEPPQGLTLLLERLALVADADNYEESADSLTLITLHQAKGLEFPVVFMVGMEEGLLPHFRSLDDPGQLEEERRLCYVGMTRAKDRLYMLRAFRRRFAGGYGPSLPSRFLQEVPASIREPRLPDASGLTPTQRGRISDWEPSMAEPAKDTPALPGLASGDKVRHPIFGEGMVVSCTASAGDNEITVAFVDAGVKKLLQSLARLEKLE